MNSSVRQEEHKSFFQREQTNGLVSVKEAEKSLQNFEYCVLILKSLKLDLGLKDENSENSMDIISSELRKSVQKEDKKLLELFENLFIKSVKLESETLKGKIKLKTQKRKFEQTKHKYSELKAICKAQLLKNKESKQGRSVAAQNRHYVCGYYKQPDSELEDQAINTFLNEKKSKSEKLFDSSNRNSRNSRNSRAAIKNQRMRSLSSDLSDLSIADGRSSVGRKSERTNSTRRGKVVFKNLLGAIKQILHDEGFMISVSRMKNQVQSSEEYDLDIRGYKNDDNSSDSLSSEIQSGSAVYKNESDIEAVKETRVDHNSFSEKWPDPPKKSKKAKVPWWLICSKDEHKALYESRSFEFKGNK